MATVSIGEPPWCRADLVQALEEFAALYGRRPIQNNAGGMLSPHLFSAWFALRALRPRVIVESGIWYGQGTWFFEQACTDAQIYSIDLNLSRLRYRSPKAIYLDRDFATIDWTAIDVEDTILFFDDHQNAYERVKTAAWLGFRRMFFEDNYPGKRGDCYSLKKALMHTGFRPEQRAAAPVQPPKPPRWWELGFGAGEPGPAAPTSAVSATLEVLPNGIDAKYLQRNLRLYYEFPPVFKCESTRWDDSWTDEEYPTTEPLLARVSADYQKVYWEEAKSYTWLCYVELR